MQMTPDEYADYIADGSKYSRHGVRWQFLRDRAMKVIEEIVAENARMRREVEAVRDDLIEKTKPNGTAVVGGPFRNKIDAVLKGGAK